MNLGLLIKEGRKAKNMSQQELADAVYVTKQAISQFENGHYEPKQHTKDLIYQALDLSTFSLTFNEPEIIYKRLQPQNSTPIYDTSSSKGGIGHLIDKPEKSFPIGYLSVPEVAGCDIIIKAKENSMSPQIEVGDWVGILRIDNWQQFLPMNRIYVIYTDQFELIRYLKKGSSDDVIKLVAVNTEYEEEEIPKSIIREIWSARAIIPFSKSQTLI